MCMMIMAKQYFKKIHKQDPIPRRNITRRCTRCHGMYIATGKYCKICPRCWLPQGEYGKRINTKEKDLAIDADCGDNMGNDDVDKS